MVGRPHHNYWGKGHFQALKKENGRLVALCLLCKRELINTARARLISHRKHCQVSETTIMKSPPREAKSEQKHGPSTEVKCEQTNLAIPHQKDNDVETNEPSEEDDDNQSVIEIYFDNKSEAFYINESSLDESNTAPKDEAMDVEIQTKKVLSYSALSHAKRKRLSSTHPPCSLVTSDGINTEESHLAFCEFLISSNLPLKALKSVYLQSFLGKLSKSYKPPSLQKLATNYVDKINEKYKIKRPTEEMDAILLLAGWKDVTVTSKHVVACLYLNMQSESQCSRVFLNIWDVDNELVSTEDETQITIIQESMDLARSRFNAKIYAIISDNPHLHVDTFDIPLWHFVCHSHLAGCLAESIIAEGDAAIVKQVLQELQTEGIERQILEKGGVRILLPSANRWCTYRDSFKCFIVNQPIVQELLTNGHCSIHPLARKYFFDDDFRAKIEMYLEFLRPISDLIYTSQKKKTTLAEISEEWLQLTLPSQFQIEFEQTRNEALTTFSMTANFLHPVYRGRRLNAEQKLIVQYFLVECLDATGLEQLLLFKRNEGIFKMLAAKKMTSYDTFWGIAELIHPKLAGLAKRLLCIPASISHIDKIFTSWSITQSATKNLLGLDLYKKLTMLHFVLNFKENI